MNYYGPREILDKDGNSTGKWHYTCENDGRVWPVGYCHLVPEWIARPLPEGAQVPLGFVSAGHLEQERQKYLPFIACYHAEGHSTSEEACECYKRYLLDNRMSFTNLDDQKLKCKVCGEWTQQVVQISGWELYPLCEAH